MGFTSLTRKEQHVIYQCLQAAVEGPFFPDWEFRILFGLDRNDVAQLIEIWPDVDHSSENTRLAINNSMNNLLGYPHQKFDIWYDYISVEPAQVAEIFHKWRGDDGFEEGGRGYFRGLM